MSIWRGNGDFTCQTDIYFFFHQNNHRPLLIVYNIIGYRWKTWLTRYSIVTTRLYCFVVQNNISLTYGQWRVVQDFYLSVASRRFLSRVGNGFRNGRRLGVGAQQRFDITARRSLKQSNLVRHFKRAFNEPDGVSRTTMIDNDNICTICPCRAGGFRGPKIRELRPNRSIETTFSHDPRNRGNECETLDLITLSLSVGLRHVVITPTACITAVR